MRSIGQVVIVMVLGIAFAAAQEKSGNFAWKAPEVGVGAFTDALGMLDREREEYATNLATYAVNLIARERASAASLDEARRYLALSLHLAPRNRRAIVANFQLSKGMVPEAVESDYSPEVLARLLFTRAQMLKQQGGGEDQLLARVFIELSAALDPRNEDAVYAAEVQRLDHGRVNWSDFTDVKREPREAAHEDGDSGSRP